MFWRTRHTKLDPKMDAGDASLLMGSLNETRLGPELARCVHYKTSVDGFLARKTFLQRKNER
jgi:hypothetical protein